MSDCKQVPAFPASVALALYDLGLAILPAPAADGKSVEGVVSGFQKWRRRLRRDKTAELLERHPCSCTAIIPHLCKTPLVVVDCDDDSALVFAEQHFGFTPLKVRTPRDQGWHLYYRAPATEVRARALRTSHDVAIDIKAGPGAIVIVPPSVRPSTGKPYIFDRGDWSLLNGLPVFSDRIDGIAPAGAGTRVGQGKRNTYLHGELLRLARDCEGLGELVLKAHALNERDCEPLLPWDEVHKIAESAWGYEQRGENWVGRGGGVFTARSEFDALIDQQDALVLLVMLRLEHRGMREEFFAVPKRMAEVQVIPKWGPKRYQHALAVLMERGFLVLRHRGGARRGDPHLFAFAGKGAETAPNTNRHLLPLCGAADSRAEVVQPSRRAA